MSKPKIYDVIATGTTEPRDIRDRFSDIINVKDFGAKGDGATDDTEAIKAALAAGINATVVFPKGDYCISDTVEIYSNGGGTYLALGESRISWIGAAAPDSYADRISEDMREAVKYNINTYGWAYYGKPMLKINWGVSGVGFASRAVVEGGSFNGNGLAAVAIKVYGFNALVHGVRISDVKNAAIVIGGDNPAVAKSTGAQISDCYLAQMYKPGKSYCGEGKPNDVGIYVHGLDNRVDNCMINFFGEAMVLRSSGNNISNTHFTIEFPHQTHTDGADYASDGEGNFLTEYPNCSNIVVDPDMDLSISGVNSFSNMHFNGGKNIIYMRNPGTYIDMYNNRMTTDIVGGFYSVKALHQKILGTEYQEAFVANGGIAQPVHINALTVFTPPYLCVRDYFPSAGINYNALDIQLDINHLTYQFNNQLLIANNLISTKAKDPVQMTSPVFTIPTGSYARVGCILLRYNTSPGVSSVLGGTVHFTFLARNIFARRGAVLKSSSGEWAVRDAAIMYGSNSHYKMFISNIPLFTTINGITYVYFNIYLGGKVGAIEATIFAHIYSMDNYCKIYMHRLLNGTNPMLITELPSSYTDLLEG